MLRVMHIKLLRLPYYYITLGILYKWASHDNANLLSWFQDSVQSWCSRRISTKRKKKYNQQQIVNFFLVVAVQKMLSGMDSICSSLCVIYYSTNLK